MLSMILERCTTSVTAFLHRIFTPCDNYAHFDFSYGTPIELDTKIEEGAR